MKICSKCKIEQDLSCFDKHQTTFDKLRNKCRLCRKQEYKEIKDIINLKRREYRKNNPNEVRQKEKKYWAQNKDKKSKKDKNYRNRHVEKYKLIKKYYRLSHKFERNIKERQKRDDNIQYRIVVNLRNRLNKAIKRNYKSGSAVRDLGCSVQDLKLWLEQQFQPGMTWENYGKEWHIDHIIPLSKVDLTDRKQFLKANHWFNLRPMWAEENLSRGNRI